MNTFHTFINHLHIFFQLLFRLLPSVLLNFLFLIAICRCSLYIVNMSHLLVVSIHYKCLLTLWVYLHIILLCLNEQQFLTLKSSKISFFFVSIFFPFKRYLPETRTLKHCPAFLLKHYFFLTLKSLMHWFFLFTQWDENSLSFVYIVR